VTSSGITAREKEDNQEVDRDETEPYNETIFGRRRPDSIAVEWTSKVLYVLEFKRTSDQRRNYRERGEARARAQHDVLVKSLEKVAGEASSSKASKRWQEKHGRKSTVEEAFQGLDNCE
jgi:hypothetical protein